MRRLFVLPISHRVLATASLSRWLSDTTSPKDDTVGGARTQEGKYANSSNTLAASEFEKLKNALAENTKAIEEARKEILYTAASAENARRESRKTAADEKFKSESAFARELLESADALGQVCKTMATYRLDNPQSPQKIASLMSGVDLSLRVVLKVLGRYGVDQMEIRAGDAFNAATMKSILTTPITEGIHDNQVSEVIKPGYMRNGDILRLAEVGVAETPES